MMYGERLRGIRERQGLTQADFANILSINRVSYTQYESEYAIMPVKHLNTLCNYFNVSFDYVFNFSNTLNYNNSLKDINKKVVGERLKEFRKENKLIQIKLADILNVANGTIADYERGRYLIATPFLYTICSKYQISADYLLGKVENPKYLK